MARSTKRGALASAACLLASVGCVFALRELPYSTSFIVRGSELSAAPNPGSFSEGPLRWDVDAYKRHPSLAAFRDAFAPACGALEGLAAARCVVSIIHERSPHGVPRVEFLDASFDPAAALRAHLAGAPGHCTARSFMLVTTLLAMGIPARVVQLIPSLAAGHTIAELWDPEHGWILFDPDYDSSLMVGDTFLSAARLTVVSEGIRWRRPPQVAPDPNIFARATVHYPDPWLYTRVGSPVAPWPFRGAFVQIGPAQFTLGPAQYLAMFGAAGFAIVALVVALISLRRQLRPNGPEVVFPVLDVEG